MLTTEQQRSRLEALLQRVQKNREILAQQRIAPMDQPVSEAPAVVAEQRSSFVSALTEPTYEPLPSELPLPEPPSDNELLSKAMESSPVAETAAAASPIVPQARESAGAPPATAETTKSSLFRETLPPQPAALSQQPASGLIKETWQPEPEEPPATRESSRPASLRRKRTLTPTPIKPVKPASYEPEAAPGVATDSFKPETIEPLKPESILPTVAEAAAESSAYEPEISPAEPLTPESLAPEPIQPFEEGAVSTEPLAVAADEPTAVAPNEPKIFEARTVETDQVAVVEDQRPNVWALDAVLERAWNLGSVKKT